MMSDLMDVEVPHVDFLSMCRQLPIPRRVPTPGFVRLVSPHHMRDLEVSQQLCDVQALRHSDLI
jgi:hypothetical protein